jgi:hypothetical protein
MFENTYTAIISTFLVFGLASDPTATMAMSARTFGISEEIKSSQSSTVKTWFARRRNLGILDFDLEWILPAKALACNSPDTGGPQLYIVLKLVCGIARAFSVFSVFYFRELLFSTSRFSYVGISNDVSDPCI